MFLFIGGVQPRTKILDREPRACPACGRMTLRHTRTDSYLSIFFVPLFPVKRGISRYACEACGSVFDEGGRKWAPPFPQAGRTCRFCGRDLNVDDNYCPHCGTPSSTTSGRRSP